MEAFFLKSYELFLKESLLYEKLEAFDNGEIYLSESEVDEIERQIDETNDENSVSEFDNTFTINKIIDDGTAVGVWCGCIF